MMDLSTLSASLSRLADHSGCTTLQQLIEVLRSVHGANPAGSNDLTKAFCQSIRVKLPDLLRWMSTGSGSMCCVRLEEAGAPADDGPVPPTPPGMAPRELVTPSMRARQRRDPEAWTLTLGQFEDTLRFCMSTPAYRRIKAMKRFVNMHDINEHFVKPWTRGTGCGLAVLTSRDVEERAKLMISHSWDGDVEETLQAVRAQADEKEIPRSTPIWFCAFANYQPEDGVGPSIQEQLAMRPFECVIQSADLKVESSGYGMVAIHTTKADLYTRLWCAHEVDRAMLEKGVEVSAAMSESYLQGIGRRIDIFLESGLCVDDCLTAADVRIDTRKARCGRESDERMLVSQILEHPDGFDRLDEAVLRFRKEALPVGIFVKLAEKGMHPDYWNEAARQNAEALLIAVKASMISPNQAMAWVEVASRSSLAWDIFNHVEDRMGTTYSSPAESMADQDRCVKARSMCVRQADLVAVMADVLPRFPRLSRLELHCDPESCTSVVEAAAKLEHLQALHLMLGPDSTGGVGCKATAEAVRKLTQLTSCHLALGRHSLRGEEGQSAIRAVGQLGHLTSLTLGEQATFGREHRGLIADALSRLQRLASLDLHFDPEDCGVLVAAVVDLPHLTALCLTFGRDSTGGSHYKAAAEALGKLVRLTSFQLELGEHSLNGEEGRAAVEAIGKLRQLTSLVLGEQQNFVREQRVLLFETLSRLRNLSRLELHCNPEDCPALVQSIAELPHLTALSLTLGHDSTGGDGYKAAAQALEKLVQLTSCRIGLSKDSLQGEEGQAALEAIGKLGHLTSLTIGRQTSLGQRQRELSFEALSRLRQLSHLELHVGPSGCRAVMDAVADLPRLAALHLTLDHDGSGECSCRAAVEAVGTLAQLRSLHLALSDTSLHGEDRKAALEAIGGLGPLTSLSIGEDNYIGAVGCAQLRRPPQLTSLSIGRGNSIGAAGLRQLRALPRLASLALWSRGTGLGGPGAVREHFEGRLLRSLQLNGEELLR